MVGILDGLGLAMFIPLLQMVDGPDQEVAPDEMGFMSFVGNLLNSMGIQLTLGVVLFIILFFFSLKGLLKFFEGYVRVWNEQYFMRSVRERNIKALARFGFDNFMNADVGRIQNTFTTEVVKVNQGYRYYFLCMQYGVSVVVYIALAFLNNPTFAALVIVGGVLSGLIFTRMHRRTKALSQKITKDSHTFQGLLIQMVGFFKYLKATGLTPLYAKKIEKTNVAIEHSQRKAGNINAAMVALREPLIILVVILVILVQVFYFNESIGVIILSLLLFYRALTYLMGLQNFWNLFLGISGSLLNMNNFLEELHQGKEKTGKNIFDRFDHNITLQNVSLIKREKVILDNINLNFQRNSTNAIIGESGSGKTTLINTLAGLLKPTSGEVLVDGRDLATYKGETFQRHIGYITQEPVIFNDTVFNNVTFFAEKTPENLKRFNEALRKASMLEFVQELEYREETLIGNHGVSLSGGQRQRVSIARELYKEVDILLLDEATSALDSETEKMIRENIEQLKGQYTMFIIAHRLSTIRNADRIILLNQGRVEADGTFEELASSSPMFKSMLELQGVIR